LAAEFSIEESSDGVNFQPALFPSSNELRLSSFDGTGEGAAFKSAPQLENNSSSTITESDGRKGTEEGECIHAAKDIGSTLTSTETIKPVHDVKTSFSSTNDLWLSSFDDTGESVALQSAPHLENNNSSMY
jgi:hypothetical protein